MRGPTLLDGRTYDVMLGNLWRLLAWGASLAEARQAILAHASVTRFPDPPTSRRSTFETIDARTATIH